MNQETLPVKKSEILFLYQSTYSIPNGDPFTGEQRYDDETKKILVSDVRIKRFIRDYFVQNLPDEKVYVLPDKSKEKKKGEGSGSALRINQLKDEFKNEKDLTTIGLLKKCIDVRLFGGIGTGKGDDAVNLTGAVQFALLNPSLNKVDMRLHQNTSVFVSSSEKGQGSIGTTTVVPYSVIQIHGWINPYSALETGLTNEDINKMFKALWNSVNNANTRSKSNQDSLLLLQVVYSDPTRKIYNLANKIKLTHPEKQEEALRERSNFEFDFEALKSIAGSDLIQSINFYTEDKLIEDSLSGGKFKKMEWN